MLLPNANINHDDLKQIVEEQFGQNITSGSRDLEFVPLGEDSWCYRFSSLWISVRRDRQGHVPAAYEVAHDLLLDGYEFVLAPLAGRDGKVVRTVGDFPVVTFPFVNARSIAVGGPATRPETDEIVAMLSRMHEAKTSAEIPREDYRFPFADELSACVAAAATNDPDCGPFSLPLHRLIARQHDYIRSLELEAHTVARLCAKDDDRLVLTHGEPSAGNVLRSDGRLILADWGGVIWGPPERDWYHARRSLSTSADCRPVFLRFYELRWILGEISEYTARFTVQHSGDQDDAAMWQRLLVYLPEVPNSNLRA